MTVKSNSIDRPFGEAACEHEIEILGSRYKDVFYHETTFNSQSLDPKTYLIIGRRGAGKTSLTRYFSFQNEISHTDSIVIDKPHIFEEQMADVANRSGKSENDAVQRLAQIWETVIWSIIFDHYQKKDKRIAAACMIAPRRRGAPALFKAILNDILASYVNTSGLIDDVFDEYIGEPLIETAIQTVLEILKDEPLIVAVDSFERYDINDQALMRATAALIQAARMFNLRFASYNLYVKVFISAEIYPHLVEDALLNTAKFVEDPVYLHWRPKELLRLICWRYYKYLEKHRKLLPISLSNTNSG